MDGGVWILAAILGIGLLQLTAYRYLAGRGGPAGNDADVMGLAPHDPGAIGENAAGDAEAPEAGRRCHDCGAINDPAFTFCRRCVRRLGA